MRIINTVAACSVHDVEERYDAPASAELYLRWAAKNREIFVFRMHGNGDQVISGIIHT